MKPKIIIPAVLFVGVAAVGAIFQNYTFIQQENLGLFLFTQDWFNAALSEARPISYILSSFLVQFYDIFLLGPVVTALLVTASYAMLAAIFSKLLPSRMSIPAALASACLIWGFSAHSLSPQLIVSIVLYILPCWALSFLFRKRAKAPGDPSLLICAVILLAGVSASVFSPKVKYTERKAAIEVSARKGDWKTVQKTATPQLCEQHREFLPYALLALNMQGRLMIGMNAYPLKGPEDLDMEGVLTREGYYFSSILSECLGCYNEAIHLMFQSSTYLNHGMGFVTLYQLIRYNIENENFEMVRKYASVLARSPRNAGLARQILKAYSSQNSRTEQGSSADNPLITNNPIHNLGTLYSAGIRSAIGNERLSAYMSLSPAE